MDCNCATHTTRPWKNLALRLQREWGAGGHKRAAGLEQRRTQGIKYLQSGAAVLLCGVGQGGALIS